ncbi:MAG: DUF3014 domain-containing protein [Acidobacteria bacterium]|nr:DUF3014 domain-containing protein [Acidobacteriota bacterium]
MTILDDRPLERSTLESTPPATAPRGPRSDALRLGVALLAILLVIAGVFVARRWLAPTTAPETLRPPGSGDAVNRGESPAAAVDLPPAGEMDAFIRGLLGGLSTRPELARWLTIDDLTSHITSAIDQIARGLSPAREARVIAPSRPFSTSTRGGRLYIAPESYARYDGLAATAASIEPSAVARAYATLKPRLEEAYQRMGGREGTLDAAVERAIVTLLETPVGTGRIEVVPGRGNSFVFADESLESLEPAQKQLLRMGPDNARVIQDQLRELARAIGISETRLPDR